MVIYMSNINRLIFVMENQRVFCEVEIKFLSVICRGVRLEVVGAHEADTVALFGLCIWRTAECM
jgi:hypothetical protein